MIKIKKANEPQMMIDFKRKNKPNEWRSYTTEIKAEIKKHILEKEQNNYCVYCERVIDYIRAINRPLMAN